MRQNGTARPRHHQSGRLSKGWQYLSGGAGILGDLRGQLVDAGEFALGADEGFQANGKTLAIQVGLLVKQMRFAQHPAVLDRRANADIGDTVAKKIVAGIRVILENLHRIYAKRRMQQVAEGNVRCRKADGAAALVAKLDDAGHGPVMPQHAGGLLHLAGLQGSADTTGGNHRAVCVTHQRDSAGRNADAGADGVDRVQITAAAAAKGKIRSGKQIGHAERRQNIAHKGRRIGTAKVVIERDMDHPVQTKCRQQPVLLCPVSKVERRIFMPKEFARMWVKGDRCRRDTLGTRRVDGSRDDRGMAPMNAIEITDCGNTGTMIERRVADRPGDRLAGDVLARCHGAALYRAKARNFNDRTWRIIGKRHCSPLSWPRKLPHLPRQRLATHGAGSILTRVGAFASAAVAARHDYPGMARSAGNTRKQGWQMNEISITSISDSVGLGGLFTEQTLALGAEYGLDLVAALLTIIIGIWAARRFSSVVREWLTRSSRIDDTLAPILSALVKYAILTLTVVVTLGNFGVETTSIIAVLGAAGLAIGLALQGTLSNVAAGLMLLFLRPFKVGDWVEAAGVSGSVREIGLFTTTIDTFDNVFISVPNSAIWTSNIINHARYGTRRMDLDIGISYDADLDAAEEAMMELAADSRVLSDPAPRFLVVSYGDSAINVRLRAYAEYDDFFDLYWDLNRRLKGVLDARGIDIPFPQRVVRHINGGPESTEGDSG